MYQTIGEEVQVVGIYMHGKFTPKKFGWRGRVLAIEKVCSVHDWRDGTVRKRKFSVQASGTLYLLEFDRDREHWTLEQLWVEA